MFESDLAKIGAVIKFGYSPKAPVPSVGKFLFVVAKDIGDFKPMSVHS